mgnify:CR=1 FL=1
MHRMIRQERINRGWSCEYVAEKTGLTAEAIRLIETGERNPSYPVLVKLEDLFQMNHRELFGGGNPRDNQKKPDGNQAEN